jgi:hypothetical protein
VQQQDRGTLELSADPAVVGTEFFDIATVEFVVTHDASWSPRLLSRYSGSNLPLMVSIPPLPRRVKSDARGDR